MALSSPSTTARILVADSFTFGRAADNGQIVPCVKPADGARSTASDGQLVPCIKPADGLITPCIKLDDSLLTPCVTVGKGIRLEVAANDGLIVPCIKVTSTLPTGQSTSGRPGASSPAVPDSGGQKGIVAGPERAHLFDKVHLPAPDFYL